MAPEPPDAATEIGNDRNEYPTEQTDDGGSATERTAEAIARFVTDGGVSVADPDPEPDHEPEDRLPTHVVISRPRPTGGRYHRNAGDSENPMAACSAVLRKEDARWDEVKRVHQPFFDPCLNPSCFGDPEEVKRGSYTVTYDECAAINTLVEWGVGTVAISKLTGVPETTCRRHRDDDCWHKTGRHHNRDDDE